jgi:uncharacterized membrane protein YvbJ
MPPAVCPNCGASVPRNANACPECGSDDQTGWSEESETGGLDLPEEEFNYDDFVKREFNQEGPVPRGLHWFWWVVAIVLVVVLLVWFA